MSNKGASYEFRNDVLLLLHEHGFWSATKPGEPRGLAPEDKVRGDILGLPVTTTVRCAQTPKLSTYVTEAQREARAEGNDVHVTVVKRRDHPTAESFVVTSLDVWLFILARLHPEAVTT